jgi:gas vesicle protein
MDKARSLRSNSISSRTNDKSSTSSPLRSPSTPCSCQGKSLTDEIRKAIREETKQIVNVFRDEIENVRAEISRIFHHLSSLEHSLKEVKSTQQRHSEEISKLKELHSRKPNGPVPVASDLSDSLREMEDRLSRRSNLIIRGMPEPVCSDHADCEESDARTVSELFQVLDVTPSSPLQIKRIGKIITGRPRLLKLQFTSQSVRDLALRKSNRLRATKFGNVYLNKDLTIMQQKEQRILLQELKERRKNNEDVAIKGGKIVQRNDVSLRREQNFHQ